MLPSMISINIGKYKIFLADPHMYSSSYSYLSHLYLYITPLFCVIFYPYLTNLYLHVEEEFKKGRYNTSEKMGKSYQKYHGFLCSLSFLGNRTKYFSRETSLCQFPNMASSGLKKMFILIILYTHGSLSVNMCLINFDFFDGRCYVIL